MFTLTAAAAQQVIKAAKEGGAEGMPLRLAASRNPDGTIDYRVGFDELNDDDIRVTCEGVEVIMTPEHLILLDETTMDFVELEPGQFHFIFLNPRDANYQQPTE